MTIQNRQPPGRPTGGEYAPTVHAESPVALTVATPRPAQLAGWPESLPTPELDYGFVDDGQIETWVKAGEHELQIRTTDYDRGSVDVEFGPDFPDDGTVREQVRAWATEAHKEFEDGLRKEMDAAAAAARHRIAAKVTGVPARLDDERLSEYADTCFKSSHTAVAEGERASVALFARRVLAEHPTAHSATLSVIEHEDGTSYTGFSVYDEDGTSLGRNDRTFGEDDGGVWDVAHNLETDSWAWDAFAPATRHGHGPCVDLHRAADWAPGTDPRT